MLCQPQTNNLPLGTTGGHDLCAQGYDSTSVMFNSEHALVPHLFFHKKIRSSVYIQKASNQGKQILKHKLNNTIFLGSNRVGTIL